MKSSKWKVGFEFMIAGRARAGTVGTVMNPAGACVRSEE